ncbi:MAG: hypothetical protein JNM86_12930 [Phycisphaerae bacterium]|nr:hypothetical protein [Phycisphaerae bacterium]MBN8596408.1 hypothetical protein [Planctomycetota bacterium]
MSAANKEKRLPGEVAPGEGQAMPGAFAAGMAIGDAHGLSGAPRTRFHTQHVIIVGTLALSVALIYGMRRYGMQSGLKFNSAELSYKRDETQHRRAVGFQRVMAELNAMNHQSTEGVRTNPFRLMGAEAGDAKNEVAPRDDSADIAKRKAEERARKLAEEFTGFKLGSIMKGRVPIARINDELVRVGDQVGESFKVAEIRPTSVTLEADGKKFTLELAEEPGAKTKAPKAK